jgi:hypothetical protein
LKPDTMSGVLRTDPRTRGYASIPWTVPLLLGRASGHGDPKTRAPAAEPDIRLFWLPNRAPGLDPMDQLWRTLKQHVEAKRTARQRRSTGSQTRPETGSSA